MEGQAGKGRREGHGRQEPLSSIVTYQKGPGQKTVRQDDATVKRGGETSSRRKRDEARREDRGKANRLREGGRRGETLMNELKGSSLLKKTKRQNRKVTLTTGVKID